MFLQAGTDLSTTACHACDCTLLVWYQGVVLQSSSVIIKGSSILALDRLLIPQRLSLTLKFENALLWHFREKASACAHCFHCFTFNVLFSYASACRAEAQSTAPARSPASATRLTTSLWLPWSPWTPCLRPTRQQVSPAAPGFVLACPWCDRRTRQRTALLV